MTQNGRLARSRRDPRRGFLRFVSGGVGAIAPQNISIETPSATIGSRGTSFDVVVGAEAVALAQAAGMIPPGTVVDPATAVFVVFARTLDSYGGITQRGRVIVETAGGSVEIRRQGFGVFVPAAGAPPIGPAPVPRHGSIADHRIHRTAIGRHDTHRQWRDPDRAAEHRHAAI
jgi:hypothetical protein